MNNRLRCPCCRMYANGYTSASDPDSQPGHNDFCICLYCASVNRYRLEADGTMIVVAMTDQEIQKLPKVYHKMIMEAVAAVKNPVIIHLE